MTLSGHFTIATLIFYFIPAPLSYLFIFISHFIVDIYPDFWSINYKKELVKNIFYVLGILFNYSLLVFILLYIFKFSLSSIILITILSMFPDITEGIYIGINNIFKKNWPNKFWFNHGGFFPFKYNNWQYSTSTFKCFSRAQTFILDMSLILVVLIILAFDYFNIILPF